MANNRIPLNGTINKLIVNGATGFILPWPKQPPVDFEEIDDNLHGRRKSFPALPEPPAYPGKPLYLLETYACEPTGYPVMKADWDGRDFIDMYKGMPFRVKPQWHSPATMPNSACRHVWKDWKVEAVRFGENITAEIMRKVLSNYKYGNGIAHIVTEYKHWFTTTYPHLSMNARVWYFEKGE